MARSLVRAGSAGAVGVGSGVIEHSVTQPLVLGGHSIKWATTFELVALLGGAAAQFFMPFTVPNVVDGIVDGSIALVAKRGTQNVMVQVHPATMPCAGMFAQRIGGPFAAAPLSAGAATQLSAGVRPAYGGISQRRIHDELV